VADEVLSSEFLLSGERITRESHKHLVSLWHKAFPDLHFTIEELIVDKDRVI
jgi:predicted ester cyclase